MHFCTQIEWTCHAKLSEIKFAVFLREGAQFTSIYNREDSDIERNG
jgi:hypothetical protein